jgi:hypothetical protein
MNVLAIGTLTGKDIRPHLEAEGKAVAALREEGLVRDVFLKLDRTGPILILNDVSAAEAAERLAAIPFITEDLATFEYVEVETLAERQQREAAGA